jgi:transcriptional regulator with XRE-family HTH domain
LLDFECKISKVDSYSDTLSGLGERARALRVLRNLQQEELASRAGIGVATVKRFERTGRASMENVLRIASVLGARDGVESLFAAPKFRSIDEAMSMSAAKQRQRVRRSR